MGQPDVMEPYIEKLKELETKLGDHHNLAVLREHIRAEGRIPGNKRRLALRLVHPYQEELCSQALSLGETIYRSRARDFVRNIQALWDAARGRRARARLLRLAERQGTVDRRPLSRAA